MYFIALVLPQPYQDEVTDFKAYMQRAYGCKVALKSPAHITLIPPFYLEQDKEEALISHLQKFEFKAFPVIFGNFSAFAPRVLFVDVKKSADLNELQQKLQDYLLPGGFNIKSSKRPFRPHITIANRDLKKEDFPKAKAHFDVLQYNGAFTADALTLLKHNGKNWDQLITSSYA